MEADTALHGGRDPLNPTQSPAPHNPAPITPAPRRFWQRLWARGHGGRNQLDATQPSVPDSSPPPTASAARRFWAGLRAEVIYHGPILAASVAEALVETAWAFHNNIAEEMDNATFVVEEEAGQGVVDGSLNDTADQSENVPGHVEVSNEESDHEVDGLGGADDAAATASDDLFSEEPTFDREVDEGIANVIDSLNETIVRAFVPHLRSLNERMAGFDSRLENVQSTAEQSCHSLNTVIGALEETLRTANISYLARFWKITTTLGSVQNQYIKKTDLGTTPEARAVSSAIQTIREDYLKIADLASNSIIREIEADINDLNADIAKSEAFTKLFDERLSKVEDHPVIKNNLADHDAVKNLRNMVKAIGDTKASAENVRLLEQALRTEITNSETGLKNRIVDLEETRSSESKHLGARIRAYWLSDEHKKKLIEATVHAVKHALANAPPDPKLEERFKSVEEEIGNVTERVNRTWKDRLSNKPRSSAGRSDPSQMETTLARENAALINQLGARDDRIAVLEAQNLNFQEEFKHQAGAISTLQSLVEGLLAASKTSHSTLSIQPGPETGAVNDAGSAYDIGSGSWCSPSGKRKATAAALEEMKAVEERSSALAHVEPKSIDKMAQEREEKRKRQTEAERETQRQLVKLQEKLQKEEAIEALLRKQMEQVRQWGSIQREEEFAEDDPVIQQSLLDHFALLKKNKTASTTSTDDELGSDSRILSVSSGTTDPTSEGSPGELPDSTDDARPTSNKKDGTQKDKRGVPDCKPSEEPKRKEDDSDDDNDESPSASGGAAALQTSQNTSTSIAEPQPNSNEQEKPTETSLKEVKKVNTAAEGSTSALAPSVAEATTTWSGVPLATAVPSSTDQNASRFCLTSPPLSAGAPESDTIDFSVQHSFKFDNIRSSKAKLARLKKSSTVRRNRPHSSIYDTISKAMEAKSVQRTETASSSLPLFTSFASPEATSTPHINSQASPPQALNQTDNLPTLLDVALLDFTDIISQPWDGNIEDALAGFMLGENANSILADSKAPSTVTSADLSFEAMEYLLADVDTPTGGVSVPSIPAQTPQSPAWTSITPPETEIDDFPQLPDNWDPFAESGTEDDGALGEMYAENIPMKDIDVETSIIYAANGQMEPRDPVHGEALNILRRVDATEESNSQMVVDSDDNSVEWEDVWKVEPTMEATPTGPIKDLQGDLAMLEDANGGEKVPEASEGEAGQDIEMVGDDFCNVSAWEPFRGKDQEDLTMEEEVFGHEAPPDSSVGNIPAQVDIEEADMGGDTVQEPTKEVVVPYDASAAPLNQPDPSMQPSFQSNHQHVPQSGLIDPGLVPHHVEGVGYASRRQDTLIAIASALDRANERHRTKIHLSNLVQMARNIERFHVTHLEDGHMVRDEEAIYHNSTTNAVEFIDGYDDTRDWSRLMQHNFPWPTQRGGKSRPELVKIPFDTQMSPFRLKKFFDPKFQLLGRVTPPGFARTQEEAQKAAEARPKKIPAAETGPSESSNSLHNVPQNSTPPPATQPQPTQPSPAPAKVHRPPRPKQTSSEPDPNAPTPRGLFPRDMYSDRIEYVPRANREFAQSIDRLRADKLKTLYRHIAHYNQQLVAAGRSALTEADLFHHAQEREHEANKRFAVKEVAKLNYAKYTIEMNVEINTVQETLDHFNSELIEEARAAERVLEGDRIAREEGLRFQEEMRAAEAQEVSQPQTCMTEIQIRIQERDKQQMARVQKDREQQAARRRVDDEGLEEEDEEDELPHK